MDSQQEKLRRLLAEQKTLTPVQTIVMRAVIAAWRSRYTLSIRQIRLKAPTRTISWSTFYRLYEKGLLQGDIATSAGEALWGVPLWHGRPIVRVTRDGVVQPIKGRFEEHLRARDRVDAERALARPTGLRRSA